ncbi:MAG: sugar transferase [Clostridiales bacterium]|jgi:lipopolysaccharide/colanic/teichoic acid biosynthesis glycosyltransferase|nr:sugar transferase [Clostridiales bacterium]
MNLTKRYLKRPFDVVLSSILIVTLSPVLIATALAIKLTSKGPVLFNQKRVGRHLVLFTLYKFRSFRQPTPFNIDQPVISGNNKNVTFVGKIIRRLKIDELPQLFNILKGDMSFVGPRPFVDIYIQRYQGWEYAKFAIRPGLTGLAQVKGNGHLTREERSYYDICYTISGFWTDFGILFKSILVVCFGEKRFFKPVPQSELTKYSNWNKPKEWNLIDLHEATTQRDKQLNLFMDYVAWVEANKI